MTTLLAGAADAATPSPSDTAGHPNAGDRKKAVWAKRAGAGVFLFFLIKGLLWLIVPPALILGARLFAQ